MLFFLDLIYRIHNSLILFRLFRRYGLLQKCNIKRILGISQHRGINTWSSFPGQFQHNLSSRISFRIIERRAQDSTNGFHFFCVLLHRSFFISLITALIFLWSLICAFIAFESPLKVNIEVYFTHIEFTRAYLRVDSNNENVTKCDKM